MKVIIAGCRDFHDAGVVHQGIMESGFKITEVVSGRAPGVDSVGEALAAQHGMPVQTFPADWKSLGPKAGPVRNRQMAQYADALIAVWDGKSRGTKNMIDEMKRLGKPVFIKMFSRDEETPGEWRCQKCYKLSAGLGACRYCGSNAC